MKPPNPTGQLPSFKGRPPPVPMGHRHSKSSDGRPPGSPAPPFSGEKPKQPLPSNRMPPINREAPRQRPRRNSDSSIMDVHEIEKEKEKAKERREKKTREARKAGAGDSGSDARRPSKSSGRPRKGAPLDIIDKLDVTGGRM